MREATFNRPQVLAVIEELAAVAGPRGTPLTHAGGNEVSPAREKTRRTNRLSEDSDPGPYCAFPV
jgi:hypothetical protein